MMPAATHSTPGKSHFTLGECSCGYEDRVTELSGGFPQSLGLYGSSSRAAERPVASCPRACCVVRLCEPMFTRLHPHRMQKRPASAATEVAVSPSGLSPRNQSAWVKITRCQSPCQGVIGFCLPNSARNAIIPYTRHGDKQDNNSMPKKTPAAISAIRLPDKRKLFASLLKGLSGPLISRFSLRFSLASSSTCFASTSPFMVATSLGFNVGVWG